MLLLGRIQFIPTQFISISTTNWTITIEYIPEPSDPLGFSLCVCLFHWRKKPRKQAKQILIILVQWEKMLIIRNTLHSPLRFLKFDLTNTYCA